MALFTLRSLRKDFGIKEILKDASFSLDEGDKVGLIGTNGSGKSTLLKIIAGLEPSDGGELWVNSSAKIIYLPQQPDLNEERTVLEQVFADSGEQMALVKEYEEISDKLSHGHGDQARLLAQLSSVSERMDQTGAWDLETNAKIVLTKLGIDDLEAKIGSLSGGYRKRIAIASALLSSPDVLLMDEPTNHLDALSVEWLQSYLNRYRGALLLITHDRYFLDKVTNRIIEIDRGDLYSYSGNYSYYLEKKAEAEESAAGRRIGKKVVELDRISKSYCDRTLIKNFSYNFTPEDRIGIIGSNGAGKSTLMNMITGRLQPDAGTVEIGTTIHFGYFDQHSDDLLEHGSQRVIDYLKDVAELVKTADGSIITASQMLERFLFPPNQQYAPINKLSGGEKRRLFLLKVLMEAPNVLILDEPTNDLDVQTLAVLEEYLEDFNGCVIVVSHDRYFLDRTVDMVFAFEKDGEVRLYPGNYSVYLDYKKEEEETQVIAPKEQKSTKATPAETSIPNPDNRKSVKLSYKEKREYEELEMKIPEMEEEKLQIEKKLYYNPPSGHTEIQKLASRLAELTEAIDQSTERWLELAERL